MWLAVVIAIVSLIGLILALVYARGMYLRFARERSAFLRRERQQVAAYHKLMTETDATTVEFQKAIETLKAKNAKLVRESKLDPLTGLLNKEGLKDAVRQERKRSRRSGKPLTVMLADIDDFGEVNSLIGHLNADQVLVEVGAIIASSLVREGDVAGRFGGDEYVMIFPDSDAEWAKNKAQELRTAIRKHFASRSSGASITVSIGVVTLTSEDEEDLITLASRAMYAAKDLGKNAVSESLTTEDG